MADEPILCFDGDRAGQKAAYRAADLALPALLPGKSLRFALLPEGQDPDDLARSGGRGAIEEVISAARPLVDMLWSREIEGGSFATPERRAALEARINELANGIRDEVLRRYYRQDLVDRLHRMFAPDAGRGGYARGNFRGGGGSESGRGFAPRNGFSQGPAGRFAPRGGRGPGAGAAPVISPGPYQAASPQLATSPIMRGQRSAMSRREALILQSLINHPWLLHDHLEEVAMLELAHPEATKLRAGIITAFAGYATLSVDKQASWSDPANLATAATPIPHFLAPDEPRGAYPTDRWLQSKPGAAREDVLATWQQLVVLHQKTHALLREKKDAELALGDEPSESNLAWLKDVSARLESLDGTEALIEGFGELSGRFRKSV